VRARAGVAPLRQSERADRRPCGCRGHPCPMYTPAAGLRRHRLGGRPVGPAAPAGIDDPPVRSNGSSFRSTFCTLGLLVLLARSAAHLFGLHRRVPTRASGVVRNLGKRRLASTATRLCALPWFLPRVLRNTHMDVGRGVPLAILLGAFQRPYEDGFADCARGSWTRFIRPGLVRRSHRLFLVRPSGSCTPGPAIIDGCAGMRLLWIPARTNGQLSGVWARPFLGHLPVSVEQGSAGHMGVRPARHGDWPAWLAVRLATLHADAP